MLVGGMGAYIFFLRRNKNIPNPVTNFNYVHRIDSRTADIKQDETVTSEEDSYTIEEINQANLGLNFEIIDEKELTGKPGYNILNSSLLGGVGSSIKEIYSLSKLGDASKLVRCSLDPKSLTLSKKATGEMTGLVHDKGKGIVQNATFKKVEGVQLRNAALLTLGWQVLSMAVAQQHLSDINEKLKDINDSINEIKNILIDDNINEIYAIIERLKVVGLSMQNSESKVSDDYMNQLIQNKQTIFKIFLNFKSILNGKLNQIYSLDYNDTKNNDILIKIDEAKNYLKYAEITLKSLYYLSSVFQVLAPWRIEENSDSAEKIKEFGNILTVGNNKIADVLQSLTQQAIKADKNLFQKAKNIFSEMAPTQMILKFEMYKTDAKKIADSGLSLVKKHEELQKQLIQPRTIYFKKF